MTTELVRAADLADVEIRTALGPTWADYSQIIDPGDDEDTIAAKLERAAVYVSQVYDSSRWWIADLLVFGEALLGDRFYQLADALGIRPATMIEWRRVGANVPRGRRVEELRFSHHRVVAALDPPAQDYWLGQAAEKGWPVQTLEDELRKAREVEAGGDGGPPPIEATVVPARVVEVARNVIATASELGDGDWRVPGEQIAQLRTALGADQ